jgi:hypothetical protein
MDTNTNKSIVELRKDMEEVRRSMAQTLGEIRQEVATGLEWQRYVQRYPEVALAAAGGLGWMIGRSLRTNRHTSSFDRAETTRQLHDSSPSTQFADQVVSLISSQILALVAVHLKNLWSSKQDAVDS